MIESLNLKGYIVTVDTEKAFDSLSHSFLLVCLKNMDMEMNLYNKNILNFEKVLDKAIQFLHTYLFYVLKLCSF